MAEAVETGKFVLFRHGIGPKPSEMLLGALSYLDNGDKDDGTKYILVTTSHVLFFPTLYVLTLAICFVSLGF